MSLIALLPDLAFLLGGTSEPNRGNPCYYSQCDHFERSLSRLSTRLVSGSQHIRPRTKGFAIFRAPCSFAPPGAKVPLCKPDLPQKNLCRNLSPPDCSSGESRTSAAQEVLRIVGEAMGGRAGARLCQQLAMKCSHATVLRLVHQASLPSSEHMRVVGVDEWAWRKGQRYGTILVDLERHVPIDLLEDATGSRPLPPGERSIPP